MTLAIIEEFQMEVYNILKSNGILKDNITNVYFSIPQNSQYPFITISYNSLSKTILHNIARYEINFEISLFFKGFKPELLKSIADVIIDCLTIEHLKLNLADIITIYNQNIEWHKAQDCSTNKLLHNFKVILQEKIYV